MSDEQAINHDVTVFIVHEARGPLYDDDTSVSVYVLDVTQADADDLAALAGSSLHMYDGGHVRIETPLPSEGQSGYRAVEVTQGPTRRVRLTGGPRHRALHLLESRKSERIETDSATLRPAKAPRYITFTTETGEPWGSMYVDRGDVKPDDETE